MNTFLPQKSCNGHLFHLACRFESSSRHALAPSGVLKIIRFFMTITLYRNGQNEERATSCSGRILHKLAEAFFLSSIDRLCKIGDQSVFLFLFSVMPGRLIPL